MILKRKKVKIILFFFFLIIFTNLLYPLFNILLMFYSLYCINKDNKIFKVFISDIIKN